MQIRNLRYPIAFIVTLGMLVSCQKEVSFQDDIQQQPDLPAGSGTTADIKGDWTFVAQWISTQSTVISTQVGQELKMIASSDYTTTDNAGHLKVTNDQFIFTGLSVTVHSVVNLKTYFDGVLFDDSDTPVDLVNPPADNILDYQHNQADSVTFPNPAGMLPLPQGLPPSTQIDPIGGHARISGDSLILDYKSVVSATIDEGGEPASLSAYSKGVMKFVR